MSCLRFSMRLGGVLLLAAASSAPALENVGIERMPDGRVALRWSGARSVDVFVADRPDAGPAAARIVSASDPDGRHDIDVPPAQRTYFLLRDNETGEVRRIAERLLPLETGSNFRDLGGYPAAQGKHVRWGLIFRSAGQPMLGDRDLALIGSLGLRNLVDLRSTEERRLAPTRIAAVPYNAIGYPFSSLTSNPATRVPGAVYRTFPDLMAPHLALVFNRLLGEGAPLAFNCSAGQDRTGFVAAMILAALGVPRDVILEDYHLTTAVRQPQYEMPKIDPVASANDPVAMQFAGYQRPERATPMPLRDAEGKSFLMFALEAVEAEHGSIEAYLEQKAGLNEARRRALAARYLE